MKERSVFNPVLVAGIVAAGVLSFVAFLLLTAYGGGAGSGRDGRAHALSTSAVGFKGLSDLAGRFMRVRHSRDESAFDQEELLILTPELGFEMEELHRVLERRRGPPTLVVMPKWMFERHPNRRGWVRARAAVGSRSLQGLTGSNADRVVPGGLASRARGLPDDVADGIELLLPSQPQLMTGDRLEPMIIADDGRMLLARLPKLNAFVLSDPDLLNNSGIDDPVRARTAIALLQALNATGAEGVVFDLTLVGLGQERSPNALRRAFEPPFLIMTLALFAAAVLAGLHGAVRFGPARRAVRAVALGKTALVENSAALLRQGKREAELGPAYADLVRHETARASAAPVNLSGPALDAYLDRLTRGGGAPFSARVQQLAAARTRDEVASAARALFQWKKDILS